MMSVERGEQSEETIRAQVSNHAFTLEQGVSQDAPKRAASRSRRSRKLSALNLHEQLGRRFLIRRESGRKTLARRTGNRRLSSAGALAAGRRRSSVRVALNFRRANFGSNDFASVEATQDLCVKFSRYLCRSQGREDTPW